MRTGIAAAAATPVDNVELKLKTRRAVEYVATVYAKDAAAAAAVKTKLADSTAVNAALTAAVSIFSPERPEPVEHCCRTSSSTMTLTKPQGHMHLRLRPTTTSSTPEPPTMLGSFFARSAIRPPGGEHGLVTPCHWWQTAISMDGRWPGSRSGLLW